MYYIYDCQVSWDEIVTKRTPVKTKDKAGCGYVAAEFKDNLVVIAGNLVSHEYIIPKNKVEDYDGKELSLNIRRDQINSDFNL
jgi:hypothetical protein